MTEMNKAFNLPDNYYPTPNALIDKMIADIDTKRQFTFLEPSAGKGNIVRRLFKKYNNLYRYERNGIDIDCIEIDVNLRQILKYNFSEERENVIREQQGEIESKVEWDREENRYTELSISDKSRLSELRGELLTFPTHDNFHIVHDNFLTFNTFKKYDVIIMNPPFDEGDKHLLKALDMQKDGGDVICLLNAETIKNPYSNTRKYLVELLNKYEAKIQYLQSEFKTAETERKTSVEVALIKVSIPKKAKTSFIFEELNKAQQKEIEQREVTELAKGDFIQNIIDQFNLEVKCTLKLIEEYEAMKPYMLRNFDKDDNVSILTLTLKYGSGTYDQGVSVNEYMQSVRMKYWRALLRNPKFTGMLTSNLQEEYYSMTEKLKDYDFSYYNIKQIQADINSRLVKGVEETILSLFDKLSEAHSWYPECQKNIHYFSGWATNKAYKINKKVIIPINGMFSEYGWTYDKFRTSPVIAKLSDIEKVLNYLDNGETAEVDLTSVLNTASDEGVTKKIPLKYFNITLYKKGTCHIEFTNQRLLDKFNIFGCRHRNWLPPSYGKKSYSDMSNKEKAAIDEFQGKEAYEQVFKENSYYLFETSGLLMLNTGELTEEQKEKTAISTENSQDAETDCELTEENNGQLSLS